MCLTCVFQKLPTSGERFATILRSHIVMCHTLLPVDLSRPRNLTSLSGLVLTTSSSQVTIDWLIGRLVDWLDGWLVNWLDGWLVD